MCDKTAAYTTDSREIDYAFDAIRDIQALTRGEKPLVILSAGKAGPMFDSLVEVIDETSGIEYELALLTCEDGREYEHLFVCARGAPYAREAIKAILDTIGSVCRDGADKRAARKTLQMVLGALLGYSARECMEFIESEVGRTCPCDCCGGVETVLGWEDES